MISDHVNKQMNASREDMEHPTEGNYASDYDIKLLQEEMQNNATQLRQKWLQVRNRAIQICDTIVVILQLDEEKENETIFLH